MRGRKREKSATNEIKTYDFHVHSIWPFFNVRKRFSTNCQRCRLFVEKKQLYTAKFYKCLIDPLILRAR